MASGGFVNKVLDHIPGYGGYRDKERRRDTDRAIRDSLVLGYTQQAQRMEAIANRLADERKIMLIGLVDKPLTRLRTFIDRVNTASYGYAPLFSDAPVDDAALGQIQAFDQALADQTDTLAEQIGRLDGADPSSPDFKSIANEIGQTVDGLSLRFDKRNEVIHSGQAQTDTNVLALLDKPQPTTAPVAYRIHQNEALSYGGINYTVQGRVTVTTPEGGWRLVQLTGGSNDQWLRAPALTGGDYYWLKREATPVAAGGQSVTLGGATYTLTSSGQGTAEVIGLQGSSGDRPVNLTHHQYGGGPAGAETLDVYTLGNDTLALTGTRIDVADLELYSSEQ